MRVNTTRSKNWTAMIGLALSLALLTPVVGQDSRDTQDKIEELEDRIARLADELHAMRNGHAGKSTESPPFSARSATRLAGYERHREMQDESQFKELEWQFLGPTNISGRVTDIAMPTPRGKSYTMYAATASGA